MTSSIERIDALVDREPLPSPRVRQQLRVAAGLSQADVAEAVGVQRLAVARWELGQVMPRKPHREAYAHLLRRLTEKYPEAATDPDAGDGGTMGP